MMRGVVPLKIRAGSCKVAEERLLAFHLECLVLHANKVFVSLTSLFTRSKCYQPPDLFPFLQGIGGDDVQNAEGIFPVIFLL